MKGRRVVITGAGAVCPFGLGADTMWAGLSQNQCALGPMPGYGEVPDLHCSVAGIVPDLDFKIIPRAFRRAMAKMGCYAYLAALEALQQAGFSDYPSDMGVSLGTTMGSPDTLIDFFTEYLGLKVLGTLRSTTFFKVMGHGAAASLALALNLTGRTLAPSAACAAGLQAIGLGYEAIAYGREDLMLCGGAEEFNVLTALTFDSIQAASHNPVPDQASRPFDKHRDGLVCSEGAGLVLLESLDHAKRRQADILGEVVGFAATTSPANIVHPDEEGIALCMTKALADSGLSLKDIAAVNAHATATIDGDRAEATAIEQVFGSQVLVNSFKGQLGHTMAACGALELIASLWMMKHNLFLPNYNLEQVDSECSGICLPTEPQQLIIPAILKNSFALGGINASLIIKQFDG